MKGKIRANENDQRILYYGVQPFALPEEVLIFIYNEEKNDKMQLYIITKGKGAYDKGLQGPLTEN